MRYIGAVTIEKPARIELRAAGAGPNMKSAGGDGRMVAPARHTYANQRELDGKPNEV